MESEIGSPKWYVLDDTEANSEDEPLAIPLLLASVVVLKAFVFVVASCVVDRDGAMKVPLLYVTARLEVAVTVTVRSLDVMGEVLLTDDDDIIAIDDVVDSRVSVEGAVEAL